MLHKKQLAEMARHILKQSQGLRDHKIMHPQRDWLIGLGLAFSIFVVSAYYSAYTYWKNKNMTASQDITTGEEVVVYRQSLVKDALARFAVRDKEREVLMFEFSGLKKEEEVAVVEVATSSPAVESTTTKETTVPTGISTSGL